MNLEIYNALLVDSSSSNADSNSSSSSNDGI